MTEEQREAQMQEHEREAREALEHFHAELVRIETEHRARTAALNRKFRRFLFAWGLATVLWLVNRLTINEDIINYLYQLACLAWAVQSALDYRRIRKAQREEPPP